MDLACAALNAGHGEVVIAVGVERCRILVVVIEHPDVLYLEALVLAAGNLTQNDRLACSDAVCDGILLIRLGILAGVARDLLLHAVNENVNLVAVGGAHAALVSTEFIDDVQRLRDGRESDLDGDRALRQTVGLCKVPAVGIGLDLLLDEQTVCVGVAHVDAVKLITRCGLDVGDLCARNKLRVVGHSVSAVRGGLCDDGEVIVRVDGRDGDVLKRHGEAAGGLGELSDLDSLVRGVRLDLYLLEIVAGEGFVGDDDARAGLDIQR